MAPLSMPPSPGRLRMSSAGHVRSASVPCRSHPLLAHVESQVAVLRSWTASPGPNPLSLAHVRALLSVLDELLRAPPAHGALGRGGATADRLLDAFLVLADAYGSFLAALVVLRQGVSKLQAAKRRRNQAKLESTARALRQAEKELVHLASAVAREAAKCAKAGRPSGDASQFEVSRTVAEAINATAAASAAVFLGVASLSEATAAAAVASSKKRLAVMALSKKKASREEKEMMALEKLQELEQCVGELESESEKVFRCLVQTRVSLLNMHTPAF